MDPYRELRDNMSRLSGESVPLLYQGIVTQVSDLTCEVEIDGLSVPDVRLRASTEVDGAQLILRPAVGSAVIVGSLTGDLDQLVLLSMDRADEVIINGGKLGGLVKIAELTDKINLLERELNDLKSALGRWTPVKSDGGAALKLAISPWSAKQLSLTRRGDFEDTKVKH